MIGKKKVLFGKIATVKSRIMGNKPVRICLLYDQPCYKSGIYFIPVLSSLAQAIYKRCEGEIVEYLTNGEKVKVEIIKVN